MHNIRNDGSLVRDKTYFIYTNNDSTAAPSDTVNLIERQRFKMLMTFFLPIMLLLPKALACDTEEVASGQYCLSKYEMKNAGFGADCDGTAPMDEQMRYLENRAAVMAVYSGDEYDTYRDLISTKIAKCKAKFIPSTESGNELNNLNDLDQFRKTKLTSSLTFEINSAIKYNDSVRLGEALQRLTKLGAPSAQLATQISAWQNDQNRIDQKAQKSCSTIDLTAKTGPRKNQGKSHLCYSVTISDLIFAKTGVEPSYIDLAVLYHQSLARKEATPKSLTDLNEGRLEPVLSLALKNGICRASQLPDDRFNYDQIASSLNFSVRKPALGAPGCEDYVGPIDQETQLLTLRNVLHQTSSIGTVDIVRKLCAKRTPLRSSFHAAAIKKPFVRGIDEALKLGDPIAVGGRLAGKFEGHAMTVVGRSWDANRHGCVYKLRDNYGTSCDGQDSKADPTCADGYHSFTADELERSIGEAVYLK